MQAFIPVIITGIYYIYVYENGVFIPLYVIFNGQSLLYIYI